MDFLISAYSNIVSKWKFFMEMYKYPSMAESALISHYIKLFPPLTQVTDLDALSEEIKKRDKLATEQSASASPSPFSLNHKNDYCSCKNASQNCKSNNCFESREQSENLINKQQENMPVNSEISSECEQKGKQSKSDDNELEEDKQPIDNQSSRDSSESHSEHHYKYECSFCHRKFTQKGNMNKHMKQHLFPDVEQRKNFKCDLCERSYTERYNLKAHMLKKHNESNKSKL